jgi:hypothetical protein
LLGCSHIFWESLTGYDEVQPEANGVTATHSFFADESRWIKRKNTALAPLPECPPAETSSTYPQGRGRCSNSAVKAQYYAEYVGSEMANPPTEGNAAWLGEERGKRNAEACRDACDTAYLCRSLAYHEQTTDASGAVVPSRCILYTTDHGCQAQLSGTVFNGQLVNGIRKTVSTHYKLATASARADRPVTYTADFKASTGLQSTGPTTNQACE